jgi:hypothetical protein
MSNREGKFGQCKKRNNILRQCKLSNFIEKYASHDLKNKTKKISTSNALYLD